MSVINQDAHTAGSANKAKKQYLQSNTWLHYCTAAWVGGVASI